MHIPLPSEYARNPYLALRRLGYAPHRDGQSFERRLRGTPYPRFHLYLNESQGGVTLNLHLDQKQPSYGGGSRAHAGEYDGETVQVEADRIVATLQS